MKTEFAEVKLTPYGVDNLMPFLPFRVLEITGGDRSKERQAGEDQDDDLHELLLFFGRDD